MIGGIDQYRPGGSSERTTLLDVTESPYNADNTGATDASAAIQSAINDSAGNNHVVWLPEGTYRLDTGLLLRYKSDLTIRGAGWTTILAPTGSVVPIEVGDGDDWPYDNWATGQITVGATAGDTTITMDDTSEIVVDDHLLLSLEDDSDWSDGFGVIRASGTVGDYNRGQMVYVISKTATTVTFSPPLLFDLPLSANPQVDPHRIIAQNVGLEDFRVDQSGSTGPYSLRFNQAHNSWIYNVNVEDTANRHLNILASTRIEARRCDFRDRSTDGSNGAGIMVERSGQVFIEDNIITEISSHIQLNDYTTQSVVSYNFCYDNTLTGVWGPSIKGNHAPHNSFNLIEGNIAPNYSEDGYHGSSSNQTVSRNWWHGAKPGGRIDGGAEDDLDGRYALDLFRFTRRTNLFGNIVGNDDSPTGNEIRYGYPQFGNDSYTGTADPDNSDNWADWAAYEAGTTTQTDFNELDLDVEPYTDARGNWETKNGALDASLGGDTVPNSYAYSARPSWLSSDFAWPPIGPDVMSNWSQGLTMDTLRAGRIIPAQYRFYSPAPAPVSYPSSSLSALL